MGKFDFLANFGLRSVLVEGLDNRSEQRSIGYFFQTEFDRPLDTLTVVLSLPAQVC